MPNFKLQVRVTILIGTLSLLFISIFTFIQLGNHLDRLNSYNNYRARVGTMIVKTTLEMMMGNLPGEEALPSIFEAAVASFGREGVVDRISIISMDGAILATNDPVIKEFGESKEDIDTYFRVSKESPQNAWFYSTINPNTRSIDIYIPLDTSTGTTYLAKLSFSTANVPKAVRDIILPLAFTIIAVIIGNLVLGYIISRTVVKPITDLNKATKEIASGNLDMNVKINTGDEIQELGDTFNLMTVALRKMREIAENSNPLTRLPGNNVIREEINKRIKSGKPFMAIHADLDNFKVYNDRYGIGKGDEIIKFTSHVLENALKTKGGAGDFIGHEGGDDFYLITSPDKADAVANAIITEFDANIKKFYSAEDAGAGYIEEKDRRGSLLRFPLMTISLAGVTNAHRKISSYPELMNIAASVKHKAKEAQKSNFFVDRRRE